MLTRILCHSQSFSFFCDSNGNHRMYTAPGSLYVRSCRNMKRFCLSRSTNSVDSRIARNVHRAIGAHTILVKLQH